MLAAHAAAMLTIAATLSLLIQIVALSSPRSSRYTPRLDGEEVVAIHTDLTAQRIGAASVDLNQAVRLNQNRGVAFMGDSKGGAFDIPGELAREWLALPTNPNGKSNSNVLRPWVNGMDVSRRPADKWIIDFGWKLDEPEAALFQAPLRAPGRSGQAFRFHPVGDSDLIRSPNPGHPVTLPVLG